MELATYELVRYPTGHCAVTRRAAKDSLSELVGYYASEDEARRVVERLTTSAVEAQPEPQSAVAA
ncbi:MAG: hypothetical protein AB7K67_11100 [Hyphomicrobiaceae bacterium]|jgi:hypothetical protein